MFILGPSFAVDTACSSSLLALDHALRAIRSGQCEAAIVGGTSLCMHPSTTAQFMKLGMLSPDGACKSFDSSGLLHSVWDRVLWSTVQDYSFKVALADKLATFLVAIFHQSCHDCA